ncbi:hypothetical protein [Endozoicomonas ascidiicola]|uniref:hypothetical protein n=1 Tax=Endozoicomonas ascidiicola TaxID=1698521 RepID=UPI00082C3172|nr:hypothetical protein [Endozoicomonas ascidiicola]
MASPGDYIGSEIRNFQPITTEWCNNGDCRKITLVNSLKTCASGEFEKELSDHGVSVKITDKNGVSVSTAYYLLKAVNTKTCNRLAPHIKSKCKSSYLLRVGDYSGGSMGWYFSTGIYGVFDLPGVGLSMVPLRFFPNDNEGLNFLEEQ